MMRKGISYAIITTCIFCAITSLLLSTHFVTGVSTTNVTVQNRHILVNNEPFIIRGVGYAPIPIGIDPEATTPYGDYYTADYSSIYDRDLLLLKQMGANSIRLWGWNNNADHADFLNKAYNNGIYVVVTYWMNSTCDISSASGRTAIKSDFRHMVEVNKNYPAILMWAIGNELDAPWMYGSRQDDLFSLINEMAQQAHLEEGSNAHPVTTPLSDTNLINTISSYDSVLPNLDIWSIQVYRGGSFGNIFNEYSIVSSKPLAILEYGIDAYDNSHPNEYELIGTPYQAVYAASLWNEIASNTNICIGGSIMAYSDEWWKGKYGTPVDYDPAYHSASGYVNLHHPDGFANEEWWGIMRTVKDGANPDVMQPREVYYALQSLWVNPTPTATPTPTPTPTPSPSPTPTPTATPTPTPTASPTPTPTPSAAPTPTPAPSIDPTTTTTPTPPQTQNPTPSPSPTATTTNTPTPSPTATPTPTPTPTATPTPTPTQSLTVTPKPETNPSATPSTTTPTPTPDSTPTITPNIPEVSSWLAIIPLIIIALFGGVMLRYRKST
jgi:hypothetical protein